MFSNTSINIGTKYIPDICFTKINNKTIRQFIGTHLTKTFDPYFGPSLKIMCSKIKVILMPPSHILDTFFIQLSKNL